MAGQKCFFSYIKSAFDWRAGLGSKQHPCPQWILPKTTRSFRSYTIYVVVSAPRRTYTSQYYVHIIMWWTTFHVLDKCNLSLLFESLHFHSEQRRKLSQPRVSVCPHFDHSVKQNIPHIPAWSRVVRPIYSFYIPWTRFWLLIKYPSPLYYSTYRRNTLKANSALTKVHVPPVSAPQSRISPKTLLHKLSEWFKRIITRKN